jgi:YD repeat-containing protein
MRIKLLCALVLVVFFLASCRKTDDTPGSFLLSNVAVSGAVTQNISLKYDSQNHLIEENDGGGAGYYYTYDLLGRVTEENDISGNAVSQYIYKYEGSHIYITVTTKSNGTVISTENRDIVVSGQQAISQDYGDGQYSLYTYDTNGDLLAQSDYLHSSPDVVFRIGYAYENNKSYFYNVNGNLFSIHPSGHIHNIKTTTFTTYFDPTKPNVLSASSTFEYNADLFPTKETRVETQPSGATSTSVYTYTYIQF